MRFETDGRELARCSRHRVARLVIGVEPIEKRRRRRIESELFVSSI